MLAQFPGLPVVVNMTKNELGNGKVVKTVEKVAAVMSKWSGAWSPDYFPDLPVDEDEERGVVVNITI